MASSRGMRLPDGLYKLFARYVALCERRAPYFLLLLLAATVLLAISASKLELHTDMAELLPDDHPAVQALRRVVPRQKSSTNLVVILESPDREANRRFGKALQAEFQKLVGKLFTEVQLHPETEIAEYQHRWRWLYTPQAELHEAESLLDRLIARRSSPLLVDLEGDPEAELSALRARLQKKLPPRPPAAHGEAADAQYFEHKAQDGKTMHLGIALWRRGDGLATLGDEETLRTVKQIVEQLSPKQFHAEMRVEYSGAIAMALAEADAVRADLTVATLVCVSLVLLSIYLYFRRVVVVLVVGVPAVFGLLLALLLARYTVHSLNANTAFLISIILGNGINSPIMLLARYGEERRGGESARRAMATAMAATLQGTLTAMVAASISYGCLLRTTLRGLSQFGLVGGAGMLLVWIFTFVLLPPLVLFGERCRPGLLTPARNLFQTPFSFIGRMSVRAPAVMTAVGVLLCLASLLPAYRYARDPLDYDPNNLRTDDKNTARLWQIMYDVGLGDVGAGHIAKDGVILVDRPEQADIVADALWKKDQALGEKSVLSEVRTLHSILPEEQPQKLAILARIREKIDAHRSLMDEKEWSELQEWRPPESLREIGVPDLPRRLRENFTEVDGTMGRLVGIDGDPMRYGENDGRGYIRLARSMEVTVLGKTWVAASASSVFAGMIEVIMKDAPKVTLLALVSVTLLLFLVFGVRGAPIVLGSLLVGLLWLAALLKLLHWKLNLFNFAALPITLGVGADYAANLYSRVRAEGQKNLATIVGDTGSAVALCSLTTIIGYSSLLLSRSRALQSFGRLANLGEAACLLSALFILPALTLVLYRKARPEKR